MKRVKLRKKLNMCLLTLKRTGSCCKNMVTFIYFANTKAMLTPVVVFYKAIYSLNKNCPILESLFITTFDIVIVANQSVVFLLTYGTKYSRVDQVKFVEESL